MIQAQRPVPRYMLESAEYSALSHKDSIVGKFRCGTDTFRPDCKLGHMKLVNWCLTISDLGRAKTLLNVFLVYAFESAKDLLRVSQ